MANISKRIENNKEELLITSESKKELLVKNKKLKEINAKLVKETKKLIFMDNLTRKQKVLELKNERFKKIETAENKTLKLYMKRSNKAWGKLICLFNSFVLLSFLNSKRKTAHLLASKYRGLLFYISKFIGRIKKNLLAYRKRKGFNWLNMYITPLVLMKISEIKQAKAVPINEAIQVYLQKYQINLTFNRWLERISKIQKSIRYFLITRRARIEALGLLWKKLINKQHKAPKFLKKHFISKYLNKKTQKFIEDMKDYKKMEFILELGEDAIAKPIFAIFLNKNEFKIYVSELGKVSHKKKRKQK